MLRTITSGVLKKLVFAVVVLLMLSTTMLFAWSRIGRLVSGTGTMRQEGGFCSIVADDGTYYDPQNLSKEFKINGLRVDFLVVDLGQSVFHMYGHVVLVLYIGKI
jgi:hypothetical protein